MERQQAEAAEQARIEQIYLEESRREAEREEAERMADMQLALRESSRQFA